MAICHIKMSASKHENRHDTWNFQLAIFNLNSIHSAALFLLMYMCHVFYILRSVRSSFHLPRVAHLFQPQRPLH